MDKVVVIYGPTAVGKSAVAVELAKLINGEIISADSMQIYKHLDVGSAKVTKDEMQNIKHYLIDIKEPIENYSAFDFCNDANMCIDTILKKGKTPIIVGGTGFYIKSLIDGYNFAKTEKQNEFRDSLKKLSCKEIYDRIIKLNANSVVDKNNKHRLIRELEKLTFAKEETKAYGSKYNFQLFAILDDRQKIYDRINQRVDRMIKGGLLEEARYLLSLNLPDDNLAIKAIGYKELFPYLKDEASLDYCSSLLKQKSRNYAKRQFTFLNQFENITKVDFCGVEQTAYKIKELI